MTTLTMIIFILLTVLILAIIVATIKFERMLTQPHMNSHSTARDYLKKTDTFDCDVLDREYKHENFTFASPRGYTLRGIIMHPNKTNFSEKPQKAVIIAHGYTGNYSTVYPYAKLMLDFGFNVVLYDHRAHGNSDRKDSKGKKICCSMGYYESKDLKDLFYFMKDKFEDDCIWGILGESMGGATIMQTAPKIPELSFAIDDCGYSSMKEESLAEFKSLHLPSFPVMQIGNALIKLLWGWSIYDISAIEAMKKTNIPVLFCHGDKDSFVPTEMVYKVYNAKKDKKVLRLYKDSIHARSLLDHPDEYKKNVQLFLKEYGILD